MLDVIEIEVKEAFVKAGYGDELGDERLIKFSDRPDLSDFQCNAAMNLARKLKKNPREIATNLVNFISDSSIFSKVTIDGPGFINLTVNNDFLAISMDNLTKNERLGCHLVKSPKNMVIDYCGPNVAKPLHVGHLRSSVIGECLKRLSRFVGDNVTADIHLGDWGRPMGLLIAEYEIANPNAVYFDDNYQGEYPKESPVTAEDLALMYPSASNRAKEDEAFLENARKKTQELQDGRAGYRALWRHFIDVSIDDLKQNLVKLDVTFDLWKGESSVNDRVREMINRFKKDGIVEKSEGAYVIKLDDGSENKEMPPFIMEKSDGAILYSSTDMATIEERVEELKANSILYVVDARQALHFEQLFKSARIAKVVSQDMELEHIKFGTVNGADGKPFKTRDGGVMRLSELIDMAIDEVRKRLEDRDNFTADELGDTAEKIGVAAIKFADLMNNREANYAFDINKFASFEGKTGPYLLYSIVRIKSIFEKAKERGIDNLETKEIIAPTEKSERDLILCLSKLPLVIEGAYTAKRPHVLCDFAFELAQCFSSFYGNCPILNNEDEKQRDSRLQLSSLVRKELELLTEILGIKTVEKM